MAPFYAPNSTGDLLARYSFIEPLLRGRRVLEVGAAGATNGEGAAFMAERGAAAVLSIDEDSEGLERAAEAIHHPFIQFRPVDPARLPLHAFDLIVVADGAALVADPERLALYAELLARDGFLLTAIRAGGAGLSQVAGLSSDEEPPTYESFVDALSKRFSVVEVATQAAMVGYMVAPAQEQSEEPDIIIDGSVAGAPEAAYYLALCGEAPSGLAGVCLVTLPVRPLAERAGGAAAKTGPDIPDLRDVQIAGLRGTVSGLEARALDQDALLADLKAEAARLRQAQAAAAARVMEMEGDLERSQETLFEAQAARDRAQASEAQRTAELDEARASSSGEAKRAIEERDRALATLEASNEEALETEAALQAARSEAQAGRSGIEAALSRAAAAEVRVEELEEALDAEKLSSQGGKQGLLEAEARAQAIQVDLDQARADLAVRDLALGEALARATGAGEELSRERARIEERMAEVEKARDEAMAQCNELRARLEKSEEEWGDLSSKAALAETAQIKVADLEGNRDRAQAKITELQENAELAEVKIADLEEDKDRSQARSIELEENAERARLRIAELEENRDRAQLRITELQENVERAETRAKELEESARGVQAQIPELVENTKGAQARIAELEESARRAQARIAELEEGARRAQARITELEEGMEESAKGAQARITELEEGMEESAKGAQARITELVENTEGAQAQIAELEERTKDGQVRIAELEENLGAAAAERDALSARIAEMIEQAEAESKAQLEDELDRALQQAKDQARVARARELEVEGAEEQGGDFPEPEFEELRQELDERAVALAQTEGHFGQTRNALETAEEQAASLEAELQAVRWEKDDLEQRFKESASLAEQKAADAAEALARTDALEARLAEIEAGGSQTPEPSTSAADADEKVKDLEARLGKALARLADAEEVVKASQGSPVGGPVAETIAAMQRITQERDGLAEQIVERDERIARLQREVTDKTDRLGRLVQEIGEAKSKGIGQLFPK